MLFLFIFLYFLPYDQKVKLKNVERFPPSNVIYSAIINTYGKGFSFVVGLQGISTLSLEWLEVEGIVGDGVIDTAVV